MENEPEQPPWLSFQTNRTRKSRKNQILLPKFPLPVRVIIIREKKKHYIKSSNDWTPAMFAARFGQKNILKFFLDEVTPDPVHFTLKSENTYIIDEFMNISEH